MSEQWDEAAARLREQADRDYPQAWIPEQEGDELFGVLADVKAQVATSFGPVPVVEIETPVGARFSVWLVHKVLRASFIRERPVLGETILIRYLGTVTPDGGGPPYENYRLVVDRVDENNDVDWDQVAAGYGDTAEPRVPVPPAPDDQSVPF